MRSSHLYTHFLVNGLVVDVPCGDRDLLRYTSRDLERMKAAGDPRVAELRAREAAEGAAVTRLRAGRTPPVRHQLRRACLSGTLSRSKGVPQYWQVYFCRTMLPRTAVVP